MLQFEPADGICDWYRIEILPRLLITDGAELLSAVTSSWSAAADLSRYVVVLFLVH